MNELESLENLMASWKLRSPSARLERRLFGARTADAPRVFERAGGAGGLAWLLDARHALGMGAGLALALAVLVAASTWPHDAVGREGVSVLASLSNRNWIACLTLGDLRHNSAPILGWTNEDHFPSTTRSLDILSTNHLLPRL
jgi:hypothetical protein